MLLAIDAGNTNCVFAIFENNKLMGQWRIATSDSRTADEYVVWLRQLLSINKIEFEDVDACIIASVVPQALFNLRQITRRYLNFEPLVVGVEGVSLGIEVRVPYPETVGADRLANAVGAHANHTGDALIIDFGTATTFDVVAADGGYEGGIICPGVNLSVQALQMAAAKLPDVAIQRPEKVIGTTTDQAMKSGIFWGYIGLIEGLVSRVKQEYGRPMQVIGTGGLAHLFRHSTDLIDKLDDDLTIDGLHEIYQRNAPA